MSRRERCLKELFTIESELAAIARFALLLLFWPISANGSASRAVAASSFVFVFFFKF